MFKTLRKKFLWMNLLSIVCILLVAFFAVGFISIQNTSRDIDNELSMRLDVPRNMPDLKGKPKDEGPGNMTYLVLVNQKKEILSLDEPSFVSMSESVYSNLLEHVEIKDEDGYFQLDGRYFAYKLKAYGNNYLVAFLDINQQVGVITEMLIAFGLVSVVSIVVVALFSNYFAGRAIAPIQKNFKKQQDFVSDASHELKTPLTIISTNVDAILTSKDATVESQKKWLDNIQEELKRTTKLTNSLLYLTKIEDEHELQHQDFDFSRVVDEECLTFEVQAFEKELSVQTNIQEHVHISGNKDLLEQVVRSLLENALKYTSAGHTIQVDLHVDQKQVKLSISNPSPTIPTEKQSRLFERFYRVDDDRNSQTGGHGLGLSICLRIVEMHKGTMAIHSQNDIFTVQVILPIQ